MTNELEINPSVPVDLRGAVDLNSAIQQAITKFKQLMLEKEGELMLCVGVTKDNQAIVVHKAASKLEVMGLAALAQRVIGEIE